MRNAFPKSPPCSFILEYAFHCVESLPQSTKSSCCSRSRHLRVATKPRHSVGASQLADSEPSHLPTDEQLDRVAEDVSWFSSPAPNSDLMYNFFEATGGRGQLDLEGLPRRMLQIARETEVGPVARPPALGGPPAPTEVFELGRGRLDTSTVRAAAVDER